ncbi:hypothetical protein SO694_001010110 [Aureococcus anophagefferens]|uniref:Uncharacterized protein n=1 Tax=Aureococcus anophagefferens TaxID=44056 RepID=A0ABR1FN09_AURAN
MAGASVLLALVATHAAAFAPPRPSRGPLLAVSYKRPDAPSPDGLSSLRSSAASGRWREALALIAAAEEAIGDRAAKGEGQAFPLPIEAYNLAITACGAAGEWREAPGALAAAHPVGGVRAFRGPAEGEDWADRRRVAFELLRRLEDRRARSSGAAVGVKSSSFLDEDGEYDVSGMTVPRARCAVRRAVYEAAADLDPKATAKASVVFITGVGR